MAKRTAIYIVFSLAVFAILFIAAQNKTDMTGVLHNKDIVIQQDEEAVPLAFSWVSAIILLIIAAVLIHIIQTRKTHSEKKANVLRTSSE